MPRRETPAPIAKPALSKTAAAPADSLTVREMLAVLRRNWQIVSAVALLVGIASAVMTVRATPVWRARGVIKLVNTRQVLAGDLASDNSAMPVGSYTDPLQSQIQILTSRSIAGAVVDSEPALLRVQTRGILPTQLAQVDLRSDADLDTVNLTFEPSRVIAKTGAFTVTAGYGTPIRLNGASFVVPARPNVPDATVKFLSREAAGAALVSRIKAKQRPESDVIDVDYIGGDPRQVQLIANRLLKVFTEASATAVRQRSQARREFIRQQLARNDSVEASAQQSLTDFRAREQMFNGKEKFTEGQRDLLALRVQRGNVASDRDVAQQLLGTIQSARGAERARALRVAISTPGINGNPVIARIHEQIVRYRTMRDSMITGRFASALSNPDVQRLDSLVAQNEEQLSDALQAYVGSLNAKIAVLDATLSQSAATLDRLPAAAAEEVRLSTQVESLHKVGEQLREQLQKAQIADAVQGGEVEVVDYATVASLVSGGKVPRILIGLLVGLVLGAGAAFLREHLDTTIKRRDDIPRVLRLPSMGVIPAIDHKYIRKRALERSMANGPNHATKRTPGASVAGVAEKYKDKLSRSAEKQMIRAAMGVEAFASLRTHMLYGEDGTRLRTVVVTSCAPKDGKSTVSSNIAEAYARSGSRVLLVDADLRRPRLHEVFDEVVEVGLTEVLNGTVTLEAAMRPIPGSRSFALLPAGSRVVNPSELVNSDAMKRFVESTRAQFDLVVIDSPPVLAVSDAAVLARYADGVLFVVKAGVTEPAIARAALMELDAVDARVLGVVLNDPNDTLARFDGDHYYSYYSQYMTA